MFIRRSNALYRQSNWMPPNYVLYYDKITMIIGIDLQYYKRLLQSIHKLMVKQMSTPGKFSILYYWVIYLNNNCVGYVHVHTRYKLQAKHPQQLNTYWIFLGPFVPMCPCVYEFTFSEIFENISGNVL